MTDTVANAWPDIKLLIELWKLDLIGSSSVRILTSTLELQHIAIIQALLTMLTDGSILSLDDISSPEQKLGHVANPEGI